MIEIKITYGAKLDKNGARLADVDMRQFNAEQEFMRVFGSFTLVEGFGGWKSPETGIHFYENSRALSAIVEDTYINRTDAARVASHVKGVFGQESVCLTITNCQFELI